MQYSAVVFLLLFLSCGSQATQVEYAALPENLKEDPNTGWILTILNYETTHGSQFGTGLPNWGFRNPKPQSIEEAILLFKRNYLPRVISYPLGVRERLGDYYFNTGRSPEDLLLYTQGVISLRQLNTEKTHTGLWKKSKKQIFISFSEKGFLHKLDCAKERVYRTTKMVNGKTNPAFEKTWKKRIWMWSTNP